jgi:hypothetical protein
LKQIESVKARNRLEIGSVEELSYEQKIVVNNLRAYLHGYRGITVYD